MLPTIQPFASPKLFQARVILTNDQILALNTTSVNIVPAPGDGTFILPLMALMRTKLVAAYTNIGLSDSYFTLAFEGSEIGSYILNDAGAGITDFSQMLESLGSPSRALIINEKAITGWGVGSYGLFSDSDKVNLPLQLVCVNDDGDLEDGNEANQIFVTITYFIFDTSTGLLLTE